MSIHATARRLGVLSVIVLAISLIAAIAVGAAAPPSLKIALSSSTVAQWDTITNVTATPRTIDGKIAAGSPVTWASSPAGIVALIPIDANGHAIAIAGLAPGVTRLVATWRTFSGKTHAVAGIVQVDVVTLQDSLIVTVNPPTITMTPFNVVLANGVYGFDPTLSPFCLYAAATDKRGTFYTGLRATWSSNDASLTDALNHRPCADTTVNPALLPALLPRP